MALKTVVHVAEDGRDKGKHFLITEAPARRAEKWAWRAFFALARSGVDIPQDIVDQGFVGFATMSLRAIAGVKWEEAEPLMDEMLAACVQAMPNPQRPEIVRPLVENDTEEIVTLLKLRAELVKLHVDFSQAAGLLTSTSASPAAAA